MGPLSGHRLSLMVSVGGLLSGDSEKWLSKMAGKTSRGFMPIASSTVEKKRAGALITVTLK